MPTCADLSLRLKSMRKNAPIRPKISRRPPRKRLPDRLLEIFRLTIGGHRKKLLSRRDLHLEA